MWAFTMFTVSLQLHVDRLKKFERVPVSVCNLGDTTHTEYKTEETSTVNTEAGIFASIVAKHEWVLFVDT